MTVRFLPPSDASDLSGRKAAGGGRRWLARLRIPPVFLCVVVVPIALAAVYLLVVASPRYVSEADFIVRQQTQHSSSVGLGGILQEAGLGQGTDQSSEVETYVMSRDAVVDLEHRLKFREMLAPAGSDALMRFPRPFEDGANEELFKAYPRFVQVEHDSLSGVSTLTVTMFRPGDAKAVAAALLDSGEALVNRLNDRAEHDAVVEADREVAEAQGKLSAAQQRLTDFRNRMGVIDPTHSSDAELEQLTKLTEQLETLEAERAGLIATAPKDPQLPALDNRIKGYQRQIDAQNVQIAGQAGSLAPKVAQYEQLTLERDFDGKMLESAVANVETARQEAANKRLYLERVVNPIRPDMAIEPKRFSYLAIVIVSAFLAYGIIVLVIAGLREHRQT